MRCERREAGRVSRRPAASRRHSGEAAGSTWAAGPGEQARVAGEQARAYSVLPHLLASRLQVLPCLQTAMAAEDESKPVKRGRGRPPKAEGEKKAKRKAEPPVDDEGNPVAKKGRGRPPGSGSKAKKAPKAKAAKGVRCCSFYVVLLNFSGWKGQRKAKEEP